MTKDARILLVDDEKAFADALAKRLDRRGFSVQVAYSAAEARRAAAESSYTAAILDVNLPDGNGHALFNEITALQPGIRVLMLTGYGDLQKAFELGKKGLYRYFGKPCEIEELEQALLSSMNE